MCLAEREKIRAVRAEQPANVNAGLTRERLSTWALLTLTVLLLYLCFRLAQPFFPAISWALALAIVAYPVFGWLEGKLGRRNWAAGVTVVLVAVLIVAPAAFVTRHTIEQGSMIREKWRSGEIAREWEQATAKNPLLAKAGEWMRERAQQGGEQVTEKANQAVPTLLTSTVLGVIQLFIALFTLYFFFRDRDAMLRFARWVMPLTDDEGREVIRLVKDTVHAALFGHVAVALIQGALGGLMFWWLGLPAPLLWGVVMGLLAIVPVLGAFVIWVPAAAFLLLQGEIWKAAVLTAWGTLVVGLIDNLLYPMFVGRRLRLHTLPVFFAIVGGLSVFGTAGIVLGPVALALAMAVLHIWRRRTAGGQTAEEALEAA